MATPTTQDRKIESQLVIIRSALSSAQHASVSINDNDIRNSSYSGFFKTFQKLDATLEQAYRELITIQNKVIR
jgi:hypothetical protein